MSYRYRALCVLAGAAMAALMCTGGAAAAGTFTKIHAFCKLANCDDGANPQAGLVEDAAGNFYGTTYGGGQGGGCGAYGCGTAFELSPKRDGKFKFSLLYTFCSQVNCDDGGHPMGNLILDTAGNLYGTANVGGGNGAGSAFELVLNGDGTRTFIVLHHFCAEINCNDGGGPQYDGFTYKGRTSGAPYDGTSPLYAAAFVGGTGGLGVVYELAPNAKGKWSEKVLYNFCTQTASIARKRTSRAAPASPGGSCSDGELPARGLLLDSAGNLYGTAQGGGVTDNGLIFELTKNGKTWTETTLYNICPDGGSCADGTYPSSPLLMGRNGNLYGVMANGANGGNGVIFQLVPNGVNSTYSVLYSFCSQGACADGSEPFGPLVMDAGGNIFGATEYGGAHALGSVYEFGGGALSTLHSFCGKVGCTDGATPGSGLIADSSGNLYGTTFDACESCTAFGSVFRLTH